MTGLTLPSGVALAACKLREAVEKVVALQDAPRRTDQAFEDAWAALHPGVRACRKCPEALEGFTEDVRLCVLKFLQEWPKRRKALKNQGTECHKILMNSPSWAETADSDGFRNFLQSECPDSSMELLKPATDRLKMDALPTAGRLGVARIPEDMAANTQRQIRDAITSMARFGYDFPSDFKSSKLDEATEAFQKLHSGVTLIFKLQEKKYPPEAIEALLCHFDTQWNDVLKFLISMDQCGVRQSLSIRLHFVATTLQSSSTGFRQAAEQSEHTWSEASRGPAEDFSGYSPAKDQVQPHASVELEKDYDYAFDLQSKEFKRRVSEKTSHTSGAALRRIFA